jgi:hypothetical protein
MSGYLSTTKTYEVTDYYSSDVWLKSTLKVTVDSSGNGSWQMIMGCSHGYYSGSLVFSINGTMIHDLYYNGGYKPIAESSPYTRSAGFPIYRGSTASGTFKVSETSFKIGLAVCVAQAAVTYDTDTNRKRLTDGTATTIGTEGAGYPEWEGYHTTFTRIKYGAVGLGKTTITDNGNNSFTITAKKGDDGTNTDGTKNTAGGPTKLKWGYTTDRVNTYTNGQTIALTRQDASSTTRTVYAASTTTATYGEDKVALESLGVNQYYAPEQPGVPALTTDSYRNGRLTLKNNWTYRWIPATKRGCSDVKGYRLRVKKNGIDISGLVYNSSTNTLTLGSGTNATVDTESTNNSISFNPGNLGFKAGDTVLLRISAYSKNGKGEQEWTVKNTSTAETTSFKLFSDPQVSEATTVQNAGVVQVKVGNDWKEGQVYVKANKNGTIQWVEAETVYVRTSDTTQPWKEST